MAKQNILIVGGGITGLVAAYLAARAGNSVTVLEANAQFGGLLNTFEVNGHALECYYHHFFTHDAEIHWLIQELGIADQLFYKKTPMGVFRKGKIYPFNSPKDLLCFRPASFFGKIRFGLTSLYLGKWANYKKYESTRALDWLYKWAGRSITDALWKPLLDIKFGPYAKEIPLTWLIGRLRQRMGSRKKGEEQLGYIQGSLQVLLNALLKALKELNVQLVGNAKVENICMKQERITEIKAARQSYQADQFLFTIPSIYTAKLLEKQAPQLAQQLAKIQYFGAVCIILEMNQPLSDTYWLNVADEGFEFGGVIEHTNFIPTTEYGGKHIAYLSRYFAHSEAIAQMSNEEIEQLMLPQLHKIYPNFDPKQLDKVRVFKTSTAATVCDLNFSQKVPHFQTEISNLYWSTMAHVYPDERSVNNSIRIAANVCQTMGISTDYVPKGRSLAGVFQED